MNYSAVFIFRFRKEIKEKIQNFVLTIVSLSKNSVQKEVAQMISVKVHKSLSNMRKYSLIGPFFVCNVIKNEFTITKNITGVRLQKITSDLPPSNYLIQMRPCKSN